MRPMAQKIFDIEPARLARCADKRRCHFRLMKGLIPDFIQAVGRAHACADPGINAIEEEQAGDTLRRFAGHGLHRRAADVVTDDPRFFDTKRIEKRQHVGGVSV